MHVELNDTNGGAPGFDFDPDALRRKYDQERLKRLRAEGNEQYIEVAGHFAKYLEDPFVEEVVRDPMAEDTDVVIIGPPEASWDTRHQDVHRTYVSHQPVGLRIYRGKIRWRACRFAWQASRHHRYRSDGRSVHPSSR